MPATLEVHGLLRPQRTQKSDLLLDPPAAVAEPHAQRFVLHLVPADAGTDDQASARQNVHLCRLFCHERRLSLGENEDRCRELQPRCDRGEVAEQHERLVERRAVVVGAGPPARPVGVSTEDVVEDHETLVSELLDRAGVLRDHLGIGPDLELREDRARPHESQYRGAPVSRGERSGGQASGLMTPSSSTTKALSGGLSPRVRSIRTTRDPPKPMAKRRSALTTARRRRLDGARLVERGPTRNWV